MSYGRHVACLTLPFALGILTQRWQILKKPIIGKPENIQTLISATTVLHNFLLIQNDRTYLPQGVADTIFGGGEGNRGNWRLGNNDLPQAVATAARNFPARASAARQAFADYFIHQGAVPWQLEYIHRRQRAA